jgi:uncharacterized small protein (DUF1192 family)
MDQVVERYKAEMPKKTETPVAAESVTTTPE